MFCRETLVTDNHVEKVYDTQTKSQTTVPMATAEDSESHPSTNFSGRVQTTLQKLKALWDSNVPLIVCF